jgi:hypothetical protein
MSKEENEQAKDRISVGRGDRARVWVVRADADHYVGKHPQALRASLFYEVSEPGELPPVDSLIRVVVDDQLTTTAAREVVTRLFCPDCGVDIRGVTEGGLPVQFLIGRFPHKSDCPCDGDIWVQTYEWAGDDTPPSFDPSSNEGVEARHEMAQRHGLGAIQVNPELFTTETDAPPDCTPTE